MTDYVAIITRFGSDGIIGEMDGVYSSWTTRGPSGFNDGQIAALQRIAPNLALAIKSVSLARMTGTLMETYLGRDAGQRVLSGRIVRGIAERLDAVIWFSDLRGFTRITDNAPDQVIPLLNDYSDAIVSAIHGHGGDVVKLIGDGTLAVFTAKDRMHACEAALSAAIAAPSISATSRAEGWRADRSPASGSRAVWLQANDLAVVALPSNIRSTGTKAGL
jgi:adenylate cyclase